MSSDMPSEAFLQSVIEELRQQLARVEAECNVLRARLAEMEGRIRTEMVCERMGR